MSNLSKSLTVAHLSWATWAIRSWSLICLERPEQLAHSRLFVLSDLGESLTVAHLIWAKWANERMSDERMSEFPALLFFLLDLVMFSDGSVIFYNSFFIQLFFIHSFFYNFKVYTFTFIRFTFYRFVFYTFVFYTVRFFRIQNFYFKKLCNTFPFKIS